MSNGKSINYIFHRSKNVSSAKLSLAPEQSDSIENQTILNALVGTLVKYDVSGRIEPYMASSWSVSDRGRRWEFKLRDNLHCEDGSEITAISYVDNLRRRLHKYALSGKVVSLTGLRGWSQFIEKNDFRHFGLKAEPPDKIIFEFDQEQPQLLEFLRMAYFGYWCGGNFIDDQFRSDQNFISSGAYRVKRNSQDGQEILLEKNPYWFSITPDSPDEVQFTIQDVEFSSLPKKNTVVRLGVSLPELKDIESFYQVRITPSILTAFILSPDAKSRFFGAHINRQVFQSRLRKIPLPGWLQENEIYPTTLFYPNSPSLAGGNRMKICRTDCYEKGDVNLEEASIAEYKDEGYLGFFDKKQEILVSLPTRLGSKVSEFMREQIRLVLREVPESRIRFEDGDSSDPDSARKMISNTYYDIRIASVDIGGNLTNSLIDMMFCTKMGVSFPDPSGKVCELVHEYSQLGKEADLAYENRFNSTLESEAYILPLFHSGLSLIYSRNFDPKTLPSGTSHPRFEDFRLMSP